MCERAPPMSWQRMDGRPADPATFQPVFLQCKGDAYDAYAAATNAPGAVYPNIYLLAAAERNRNQTLDAVMQGCMSKAGYVWATAKPQRWSKAGATQEAFTQDRYACIQEAQQGRSVMNLPLFCRV
jgi:hypothetical protein